MLKAGEALLLDTSAIIAGFKRDPRVLESFGSAGTLHVPVIAYGELYTGALKSKAPDKKLEQLAAFMKAVTLLDVGRNTARQYGSLRRQLEKDGTPIPENDIWIAAIAIQHDLKLFSADSHFRKVEGLHLEFFKP